MGIFYYIKDFKNMIAMEIITPIPPFINFDNNTDYMPIPSENTQSKKIELLIPEEKEARLIYDKLQQKLSNLKIFACGAGAVGCELLKNLAFMGVSTGEEGCVSLSDFDYIEISNLNRQFLFNNENINQSKSKVACETIKKMNKDFKCKDYQLKVCKETENIFCPSFWESQDIIISGVDDNKARMYLNDQCFKYNKILINIGTSGVKARGDIVIPEVTFPLALDMNEREIDIDSCTIKKFPFKIEHCIQWSQNYFHILFQENVKIFNDFILSEDEFISNLFKEPENVIINKFKIIKLISDLLLTDDNIERSYKIIDIGVYLFYKLFVKSIEDVFKEHPSNSRINDVLFWSGARKKPYTLSLNPNDDMMYQFLISFNSIICQCLGIQKEEKFFNKNNFNNLLIEKFERYKLDKEIIKIDNQDINVKLKEIKNQIIKRKKNFCKLNQIEFEKDGLNNNHLEFIQACSDLRARNYSIKEEDKNKILMIVGKNIAAVPTTTSSIVGYISLQIINLLYTYDTENVVKNIFINLGLNIMDLLPQQKIEPEEEKISKYPSIEINGSKTCEEFLQYFKDNYNLEIFHLEINDKIIYDTRVLKDPQKIKKQVEKTKKKLENLYMEQIEISKEKFNLTEKKFEIKNGQAPKIIDIIQFIFEKYKQEVGNKLSVNENIVKLCKTKIIIEISDISSMLKDLKFNYKKIPRYFVISLIKNNQYQLDSKMKFLTKFKDEETNENYILAGYIIKKIIDGKEKYIPIYLRQIKNELEYRSSEGKKIQKIDEQNLFDNSEGTIEVIFYKRVIQR